MQPRSKYVLVLASTYTSSALQAEGNLNGGFFVRSVMFDGKEG